VVGDIGLKKWPPVEECRHRVSVAPSAFSLNPKQVKLTERADSAANLPILHAEAESDALLPGPYFAVLFKARIAGNFIGQLCH
jgi:hypothetical protein